MGGTASFRPDKSAHVYQMVVNRALDTDRHTIAEEESWAVELNSGTVDSKEGIASFQERRDPEWRGF